MNRKKVLTKKKVTGVAALLVALAIIVTGTFAWKDFSQFANSLFKADASVTEARHWVSLVDEFKDATNAEKTELTDWKSGVASAKEVYVTSDPGDGNADLTGYDDDPDVQDEYGDVYVRVKVEQTLKIGGVTKAQTEDTTAINQYPAYVKWNDNASIKTIAEWVGAGSPRDQEYWILDTDDWLYWSEPLAFKAETSHLLDSVTLLDEPTEDLEYTVNVKLEAVSEDLKSTTGEEEYLGGFEDWEIASTDPIMELFGGYSYTIGGYNSQIMSEGATQQLTLTTTPSTKWTPEVTWSSSEPTVATVDSTGLVTTVGNGITTIRATIDEEIVSTVNIIVTTATGTFTDTNSASSTVWRVLKNDGKGNVLIITEHVYNEGQVYNTTNAWTLYESSDLKNNATTGMDAWYGNTNNVSTTLKGIALDYAYQDNDGNPDTNKGIVESGAGVERTSPTTGTWNASATDKKAITVPRDTDTKGIGSEKVFALSVSEANVYFGVDTAGNTARIAKNTSGVETRWWLRSPGSSSYPTSGVGTAGNAGPASSTTIGFRSALWINP